MATFDSAQFDSLVADVKSKEQAYLDANDVCVSATDASAKAQAAANDATAKVNAAHTDVSAAAQAVKAYLDTLTAA